MEKLAELPDIVRLSPEEEQVSSGIVGFTFPGLDADDLVKFAWQRSILIKTRNLAAGMPSRKSIRVSLHFFNTNDEILRLMDCLRAYRGLA